MLLPLLIVVGLLASAGKPSFETGDVDQLTCRIVKNPGKGFQGLLVVEVTNKSRLTAEPLAIELTSDAKDLASNSVVHHRAGYPCFGRAGRSVAPGKKERYYLPTSYLGDDKDKLRASVVLASFFRGSSIDDEPVKVGKLRSTSRFDDFEKRDIDYTEVELTNSTDHTVDAILVASNGPRDPQLLFLERLDPKEQRVVGGNDSDSHYMGRPPTFPSVDGEFKKIRLIDWSVVVDRGEKRATEALTAALARQYRWATPHPTVRGSIDFVIDAKADSRGVPSARGTATFEVGPDDKLVVKASPAIVIPTLSEAIGMSLAPLQIASIDKVIADHHISMDRIGEETVILLESDNSHRCSLCSPEVLHLRDGEIVGHSDVSIATDMGLRITHQTVGENLTLPAERSEVSVVLGKETLLQRFRFDYAPEGSHILPRSVKMEYFQLGSGALEVAVDVTIREASIEESPTAEPLSTGPSGSGVTELRKAWEAAYRFPDEAVSLDGKVNITTPGQPEDWRRREGVSGDFTFEGYTGHPPEGGGFVYSSGKVSLEDFKDTEARDQLEHLVQLRYTIWTRQDFCGRAPFNVTFRDQTIEPSGEGIFLVAGGDIAKVIVENGLVESIFFNDGTRRRFAFRKQEGVWLPKEVTNEGGKLTSHFDVRYGKGPNGRFVPTSIVMRDWFYPGWGPETYEFKLRNR